MAANSGRPEQIELNIKRPGLRFVAVAVLVGVALAAFGSALMGLLDNGGWIDLPVDPTSKENCGADFRLQVDSSVLSTAGRKQLSLAYTRASEEAFAIFHASGHFDGFTNLFDISAKAGETCIVEPALYRALSLLEGRGERWLYLAPVYAQYRSIFTCTNDREAADFDPRVSQEADAFLREALVFCSDSSHVNLELLDDNQVRLTVSDAYRAFARENEIVSYLDFGWMRNAFVIDYLADSLQAAGFSRLLLTSADGFGVCLDDSETAYNLSLYHLSETMLDRPASIRYTGPLRLATLRSYPLGDSGGGYYVWEDGRTVSPYIDPADGLDRCAVSELTSFSREKSCGEIVLAAAPVYIEEMLDVRRLDTELAEEGIWSVYWQENGSPVLNAPEDSGVVLVFPE